MSLEHRSQIDAVRKQVEDFERRLLAEKDTFLIRRLKRQLGEARKVLRHLVTQKGEKK